MLRVAATSAAAIGNTVLGRRLRTGGVEAVHLAEEPRGRARDGDQRSAHASMLGHVLLPPRGATPWPGACCSRPIRISRPRQKAINEAHLDHYPIEALDPPKGHSVPGGRRSADRGRPDTCPSQGLDSSGTNGRLISCTIKVSASSLMPYRWLDIEAGSGRAHAAREPPASVPTSFRSCSQGRLCVA